ncbi:MAG: 50S ribosomal protein L19 [Planctomycetota bacterium]|jgi:large subunit ribosomal protein L19
MSEIRRIEQAFAREEVPKFVVGDTVDVHVRIREGDKERIQIFNGTVIRRRGGGLGATYTVRRIVQGQGVERTFPLHSPFIKQVTVKRSGKVRRARLYYLRDLTGKATRLKEIITRKPDATRKVKRSSAPKEPEPAPEPEPVEASEAAKD